MFFGWEGVGLASYLLIGFWYKKPSANAAALKAFVVNRVGDFGFMLGIFAIFTFFKTLDFDAVFAAAPRDGRKDVPVRRLQRGHPDHDLPAAVHGRDGQVGAAPAPHLAARRDGRPDAGLRLDPCRDHGDGRRVHGCRGFRRCSSFRPSRSGVVTLVGATTAFFAATIGVAQNDIKRVIAYSTCSQLGYMFAALGLRAYSAGIFHLFTHAFFKALLFLAAGSVIHALHGEQDLRKMGGLRSAIPFTFMMMLAGTLALTGFPYTAGYFSKDAIIEVAHASHAPGAEYAFWALIIAAFLTSQYVTESRRYT